MGFQRYAETARESVDWNLNKGFSDEVIIPLVNQVNAAASVGDAKLWYNTLRILYRNVSGHKSMSKDTMDKIDSDMKKMREQIPYMSPFVQISKPLDRYNYKMVLSKLDDINKQLIDSMYAAGLIFPSDKKDPRYAGLDIKG